MSENAGNYLAELLEPLLYIKKDTGEVIYEEQRYSYSQLKEWGASLASILQKEGFQREQDALVIIEDPLNFLIVFLAVAQLGGTVIPVHSESSEVNIRNILKTMKPRYILADVAIPPQWSPALCHCCDNAVFITNCGNESNKLKEMLKQKVILADYQNLSASTELVSITDLSEDLPLVRFFTSGTTGNPKGVIHTRRTIVEGAKISAMTYCVKQDDRVLVAAPLYHSSGLMPTLSALYSGATVILIHKFMPKKFIKLIDELKPNIVKAPAIMYQIVARMPVREKYNFDFIRGCYSGSAKLHAEDKLKFQQKYGNVIREMYATTETSLIAAEVSDDVINRQNYVGRIAKGVMVKIFDDNMEDVSGTEKDGQIAVYSEAVAKGYNTANSISNSEHSSFSKGAFFTGDIGKTDEDGNLWLVGRTKRMINVGGKKVYAEEIESILLSHELVEEAAVFPIPNPITGESVGASITCKGELSDKELRNFCKQYLADYKVPQRIEICSKIPKAKMDTKFFREGVNKNE